jgi:YteA family regulatory protein
MNQEMQIRLRNQLLQEKESTEKRLRHMDEEALGIPLRDSVGELSAYDNHPADLGSETFERSKDLALREQGEHHLRKIDDALEHINNGKYGLCDQCGREISLERLMAVPETILCKDCKEAEEHLPDRHIRPIEEDVISPPFGGQLNDQIMFDGEDAWQSVARYGTSETPQDLGTNEVHDYDHIYVDADENLGAVDIVDQIRYKKDRDGVYYQDFEGKSEE